MPQFNYTAVNQQGEKVTALIEAQSEDEVRVFLRSQKLRPIKISQASVFEADLGKIIGFGSKIKLTDIILFTRQLSILIGSGVPLVQSLDVIGSQMKHPEFKKIILTMKEKISAGTFLWESMSSYKNIFSDIYVSLIKAGEASGSLDVILKRVIKYLDDIDKLVKSIKSAMMYPVIVSIVGVVVVIGMLAFIIPKFEELLKNSNQALPLPTQIVISLSHFVQSNFLIIVLALVGLGLGIRMYLNTEEGKRFFDYNIFKVPLIGDLMNKVAIARFSRTMQTLLSSGVNLLDALEICKDAVGNKAISELIVKMKAEVEQGKTLSSIMSKNSLFPPMSVQMVTVGENTGNLDKMLEKVADWYEEEVSMAVANLTKLIEPFVLVVLGGLVAGMLLAMYLPVFKLSGGAGGM